MSRDIGKVRVNDEQSVKLRGKGETRYSLITNKLGIIVSSSFQLMEAVTKPCYVSNTFNPMITVL